MIRRNSSTTRSRRRFPRISKKISRMRVSASRRVRRRRRKRKTEKRSRKNPNPRARPFTTSSSRRLAWAGSRRASRVCPRSRRCCGRRRARSRRRRRRRKRGVSRREPRGPNQGEGPKPKPNETNAFPSAPPSARRGATGWWFPARRSSRSVVNRVVTRVMTRVVTRVVRVRLLPLNPSRSWAGSRTARATPARATRSS